LTDRSSREASGEERPLLVKLLNQAEKIVYYGAALALLVKVGMLFVSVGTSMLAVFKSEGLQTVLIVLDRVLLIFIFVE
jgi:hypothetical protein